MAKVSDINWLYNKYYSDNPELRRIVTVHSKLVAKKAIEIYHNKKLELDPIDIYCGALLHDIGVVECNAPDIYAFGQLPYIRHGIAGALILEQHGLSQYAGICLRHTGAGITVDDIKKNHLDLPEIDMTPQSLLEKLICYADKFFSKGENLTSEKPLESVMNQMKKYGEESYSRFLSYHDLFS